MLLTHKKFKEFIKKDIADTSKNSEVILALSVDSKEKVDEMFNEACSRWHRNNRIFRPWPYGAKKFPGFRWAPLGSFVYVYE